MSKIYPPINFKQWIEDNREFLKPPVGNKVVWKNGEFIIMVVGGPNNRTDFHYNETPEFFHQIEGDIVLRIIEDGKIKNIDIKEGEIFLLPAKIPHSPQRKANTVGLVVEYPREEGVKDALQWYCESCNSKVYEESFLLEDIEVDLKKIFDKFYPDEKLRTCANCEEILSV